MADAFDPSPFSTVLPKAVRNVSLEDLRYYVRYRKTGLPLANLTKQLYRNWIDTHIWDDQQVWDG